MELQLCQCCGMPLGTPEDNYGTEADGTKSADYCKYCYEKGKFLFEGTMEEMIEFCVPHMVEHNAGMTAAAARAQMQAFFPTLKHWQ